MNPVALADERAWTGRYGEESKRVAREYLMARHYATDDKVAALDAEYMRYLSENQGVTE